MNLGGIADPKFLAVLRRTALIGPLLLSTLVAGQTDSPVTAQANQLANSGKTRAAIALLEGALQANAKDSKAWLLLGTLYAQEGDPREKVEHALTEALHLNPRSIPAAATLASFYIESKSFDSAESVLTSALRQHPAEADLRMQLATVLAAQRKYKEAQAAIRSIPPPSEPAAHVQYLRLEASIGSGLGNPEAAAHFMEEAVRLMPKNDDLRLLAAITEAKTQLWASCLENITPIYARHPGPSTGILLLQAELGTHNDYEATLQDLDAMNLPQSQQVQVRTQCAAILASADKHADAEKQLRSALEISGGQDDNLTYNLAVEQYLIGQLNEARSTLEPLRARQDSAEVEELLGDIEEKAGNRAASLERHRDAIRLAPEEERFRLSLGAELLKYHAYEDALSVFEDAAKRFPTSARVLVGLGMCNFFLERYEESASAFLHAEQLDGSSGRALGYLGSTQNEIPTGPTQSAVDAVCARAANRPSEAVSVSWCGTLLFRKAYLADNKAVAKDVIARLRQANRLAPANALTNCSLGQALLWAGQLAESRHWLEMCVQQRPDSAEDHYRLRQLYQALGLGEAAAKEAELTAKANENRNAKEGLPENIAPEMLGSSSPNESEHPK